jgi:preprotein translocase subunit SecG
MQTTTLGSALQIIQIIVSVALIVVIILQARGMGLGSLFGGDSGMGITKTRRGLEKTLFQITIILSAVFLILAVVQLMIQPGGASPVGLQ